MRSAHFKKLGNIWSTSQSWQGLQAALAAKMPQQRVAFFFDKSIYLVKKLINGRYTFQYMHFLKRVDAYRRIAEGTFKPKTLLRSPFKPKRYKKRFVRRCRHLLSLHPWRTGFYRSTIRNSIRFRLATQILKDKALLLYYRWRKYVKWKKSRVVSKPIRSYKFYSRYYNIIRENPFSGWFIRRNKMKSRQRKPFASLFLKQGQSCFGHSRFYIPVSHIININPAINNTFLSFTGPHRNYLSLTNKMNAKLLRMGRKKRYYLPSLGKTLAFKSAGMVGFHGPKRSTPFAAEETGRSLAKSIKSKKLKTPKIWLISHSYRNKFTSAAIRGLLDSRYKIRPRNFFIHPPIPYSKGMRKPKLRRV